MIPQPLQEYSPQISTNFNNFLLQPNNQQQKWNSSTYIDWNYINELNPDLIRKTKDVDKLQSLINFISQVEILPNDKTTFSHPLAPRLFQLLQVLIEYLIFCQKNLSEKLQEKSKENSKNKKKIKSLTIENSKLESSYKKFLNGYKQACSIIDQIHQPKETCPICSKPFMKGDYLDKHFESKHKEYLNHWKAIRTQQPSESHNDEIKELIDQIKELKQETIEKKKKYEMTQKKLRKREIEKEDPLESTLVDLNGQLLEACDTLNSSVELYRKSRKNRTSHINPNNPFSHSNKNICQQQCFAQQQFMCQQPQQQRFSLSNNFCNNSLNILPNEIPQNGLGFQQQEMQLPQYQMQIQQQQQLLQQQFQQQQLQQQQQQFQQQQQLQEQQQKQQLQQLQEQQQQQLQQQQQQQLQQQQKQQQQLQQQQLQQKQQLQQQKQVQQQIKTKQIYKQSNPTFQQARNFLDPSYREAKYKYSDEQMEKMIASVSSKIQQELASATSKALLNQTKSTQQEPIQTSLNSLPQTKPQSQLQNQNLNSNLQIDPSSEKPLKTKRRHSHQKSKKLDRPKESFVVNSSIAEYSNANEPHFNDSDDNCSYNEDSGDDPFMVENSSPNQESEIEVNNTKQKQNNIKPNSNKETKKESNIQSSNSNKEIKKESNAQSSIQKKVINVPEETQKKVEVGIISRTNYQEDKKEKNDCQFEIESSSKDTKKTKKEAPKNDNQSKPQTPKTNTHYEYQDCIEITNQELNDLLKESTDVGEEEPQKEEVPKQPERKYELHELLNLEEEHKQKMKKKVKTPKNKTKENDKVKANLAVEKPSFLNVSNKKVEDKKYVDCGGVKITNSELEELLCESNNDEQDSKNLTKNSVCDTFYQGIPDNKKDIFNPDDIDELLNDESFNENDLNELSHLKELPKPQKKKSKFDLSYLDDVPGPEEFQQMKMQKQLQEENDTKPKGLRLLSLGAILPNTSQQNTS